MNIITSQIIPVNRSHVDTDLIIPAEFLRLVTKKGFGKHLFARLRAADKSFPFNLEKYQGSKMMIAGMNFGYGSSREHAAWALADWGIQRMLIQLNFWQPVICFRRLQDKRFKLIKQLWEKTPLSMEQESISME